MATEGNRIVNITVQGQVTSRRVHRFTDCPILDHGADRTGTNLTEREAKLLGLAECKVCLKRAEGGPALIAITELLSSGIGNEASSHEEDARRLLDGLKSRGFYISQRLPKE